MKRKPRGSTSSLDEEEKGENVSAASSVESHPPELAEQLGVPALALPVEACPDSQVPPDSLTVDEPLGGQCDDYPDVEPTIPADDAQMFPDTQLIQDDSRDGTSAAAPDTQVLPEPELGPQLATHSVDDDVVVETQGSIAPTELDNSLSPTETEKTPSSVAARATVDLRSPSPVREVRHEQKDHGKKVGPEPEQDLTSVRARIEELRHIQNTMKHNLMF